MLQYPLSLGLMLVQWSIVWGAAPYTAMLQYPLSLGLMLVQWSIQWLDRCLRGAAPYTDCTVLTAPSDCTIRRHHPTAPCTQKSQTGGRAKSVRHHTRRVGFRAGDNSVIPPLLTRNVTSARVEMLMQSSARAYQVSHRCLSSAGSAALMLTYLQNPK